MEEKEHNCNNCADCDCTDEQKTQEAIEHIAKDQESILKQNQELKKQYGDIRDTLQRVYAEFQNYKKRMDDDKQKFIELSNEELIKRILPILDNLELALSHKKQDDEFSKGIELIYAQFTQVLEDEGVKRILSSGKFDPKLHEVLMTEESPKEEGVILEELQKGYMLGGRVLRHAKVKIAKNAKK
jgi:molecular chaperone GrpE